MKTWKKYMLIYIPIGLFCWFINFYAKKDNRAPYVEYHRKRQFSRITQN